ncbi:hypothetical protein RN001_010106 [Aquatica leii]|uniref:Uncharacterized protein n=1 Tax=Aquatica leii TaxID=1421715 RepID=A0AAN7P0F7_9COLE|nr:hypothetical protein RN001_010106 [Aquatica leii]
MWYVNWPATAFVTLFIIVMVIIILLRFGPQICRTRHTTLPERRDWQHQTYAQPIGFESLA